MNVRGLFWVTYTMVIVYVAVELVRYARTFFVSGV